MDTLPTFFGGDPASRMTTNLDAEDFQSSEGRGPGTRLRRKGEGNTPERPRRPAERQSHPFITCSVGDGGDRWHRREPTGCKVGVPGTGGGRGDDTPPSSGREGPSPPYPSAESTPCRPPPRNRPWWGDMDTHDDMGFSPDADPSGRRHGPQAEDPWMADRLENCQAEDRPEDRQEKDHLVDPRAEGPQTEDPLEDHQAETPPTNRREWTFPRTSGNGSCTSRGRSGTSSARRRSTRLSWARVPPSPPRPKRS